MLCLYCTVRTVTEETSRAVCPGPLHDSPSPNSTIHPMAFEKRRAIPLVSGLIGGSDSKPCFLDPKMKFSSSFPQSPATADAFLLSLLYIGRAEAALPCDAVRAAAASVRLYLFT